MSSNSSGFRKQVAQGSLLGNSYNQIDERNRRGKRSVTNQGGSHNSLWPNRSSNSRSEFGGHLREIDEDFEDDDDEVIPEDDEEDTEIDTVCKSSVRSQMGINGGSGGTTGSSNRHSSLSSSIDAKDDLSLVAMPTSGIPTQTTTKRSHEMKRPSDVSGSTKNIAGIIVNVSTQAQGRECIKEDLQKIYPTPVTYASDHDGGNVEKTVGSPVAFLPSPDSLLRPSAIPPPSPLIEFLPSFTKSPQCVGVESDTGGDCQSPAPLPDPQPVDLQTPLLVGMGCNNNCTWIESPRMETVPQILHDTSCMLYDDEEENTTEAGDPDYDSSLSLSDATLSSSRESAISSSYENCYYFASAEKLGGDRLQTPSRKRPSIYTEFVETI